MVIFKDLYAVDQVSISDIQPTKVTCFNYILRGRFSEVILRRNCDLTLSLRRSTEYKLLMLKNWQQISTAINIICSRVWGQRPASF